MTADELIHQTGPGEPFAAGLAKVAELGSAASEEFAVDRYLEPDGSAAVANWVTVTQLATSPDLVRWLVTGTRPELIAASLVTGVVRAGLGSAVALWLTQRRIPDLGPGNLLVRATGGGITAAALVRATGAVLTGDTLAGHPDVVTLVGAPAGGAWLRDRIVATVTPLIPAVAPYAKRSERNHWRAVTDVVAGVFLAVGGKLSQQDQAIAEATAILAGPPPLRGDPGYRTVEHAGRRAVVRRLTVCCGYFRAGDPDLCPPCPLIDECTFLDGVRARLES